MSQATILLYIVTNNNAIAESTCNILANVALNLKSKSILIQEFVWMRPAWKNVFCKDRFVIKEVSKSFSAPRVS